MGNKLIWLFMFIGSTLGGALPLLWGGDSFSISSLVLSAAGGLVGIWVGFTLSNWY